MLIAARRSKLQELIARHGMSHLEELASELKVSPSTIRRDVEMLEQRGVVKRTHGGVIWIGDRQNGAPGSRPYAFDQRMSYQAEAKRSIARAARRLVQRGETILIDGGTTTFNLAQELTGEPLQIVTNSLPIAGLFQNDDNVELVLIGGLLYPRYGVLLGPQTESALGAIHTRTMFLSVAGVHGNSLYNQNLLLVQAEQKMMQQAQQVVLLVDSSKFGQQALVRLCGLDQIHIVVSDAGLAEGHRAQVRAAGCELIIAEAD
jgi:DeoR family transcriptional regulator, fructose operon transcriptional repressor